MADRNRPEEVETECVGKPFHCEELVAGAGSWPLVAAYSGSSEPSTGRRLRTPASATTAASTRKTSAP
jgi:hypothetical protein